MNFYPHPVYAIDNPGPPPANTFSVSFAPKGPDFASLTDITSNSIVSTLISFIMIGATLIFFFTLISGGIRWLTSNGDEKAVGTARSQITNAVIGLTIVFATWAILQLIETIFGVKILTGLTIPTL